VLSSPCGRKWLSPELTTPSRHPFRPGHPKGIGCAPV
jgi:hypothetical protein